MSERERFEAWAHKHWRLCEIDISRCPHQRDEYSEPETQDAWEAWQAACPEGYSVVPKKITAESGHKCALIGEFSESVTMPCPECFDFETANNDCEYCNGEGEYQQPVPIEWSTIKRINDVVVQVSAATKLEGAE